MCYNCLVRRRARSFAPNVPIPRTRESAGGSELRVVTVMTEHRLKALDPGPFLPRLVARRSTLAVVAALFAAHSVTLAATSLEIVAPPAPLAAAPPREADWRLPQTDDLAESGDEILLISCRSIGSRCDSASMLKGLRCERQFRTGGRATEWQSLTWAETLRDLNRPRPTIAYVHGNRIERGEDKSQGVRMYNILRGHQPAATPLRFVIWSWPAEQVGGPVQDYKIKGQRTRPAAWQLAWTIDQLPTDTPLSLVGYSYGARVVTGSLHLLAGGELDGLALTPRLHPDRPPMKVALLAAAVRADWLRPGGYHGRAVTAADDVLLVNNRRDPIMRLFHLTSEGNGANALGYAGVPGLRGSLASHVHMIDVTSQVGRHHALAEYLGAGGVVTSPLQQAVQTPLFPKPLLPPGRSESAVADRIHSAGRQ